MDVRSFDWDDSELIRAYNRGLEARNAENNKKKNSQPKENKRRKWNVGDYCRAIYSDDKEYYEARVVSLNGDFCTVEFVGYDETEDVDLLKLKESEGKNARKKQARSVGITEFESTSLDESEITEGTVASYSSYRKKKRHVKKPANDTTFDTTVLETTFHQQYPAAAAAPPYYAPPAPMPTNMPYAATMPQYPVPAPPTVPQYAVPAAPPMQQYAVPAPPPMPQCPSLANNPSLSSMLTAWYFAGYYTGAHSAQGSQRCCNHSCHN